MFNVQTHSIVLTLAVCSLPSHPALRQAQSDGYISDASQLKGKKILLVAGEPEKGETNDDAR